jgi:CDP-diacylglycerol--glycerol-3-phosphate 3-phosphatidyltransferase
MATDLQLPTTGRTASTVNQRRPTMPAWPLLRAVPAALIGFRAAAGAWLLWSASGGRVSPWFLPVVGLGFVSDVCDGILARRLGVSSARLRRTDSWADLGFYGCIAVSAWLACGDLLRPFFGALAGFFTTWLAWWAVTLTKYRRPSCHHTYIAKAWGWALLGASVALFGFGYAGVTLALAIALGVVNNIEDIIITLLLPVWTHDVPGIPAALRLRRALSLTVRRDSC